MKLLHQGVDLPYEGPSLLGNVDLHAVISLQHVPQVLHLCDPRQLITIQQNILWLEISLHFLCKNYALCLGLIRVTICSKL